SQPHTFVLAMIRGMDPSAPADDLVNLARFVPKANRYTAFWDKNQDGHISNDNELSSIDHILVDPALVGRVESVDMPHDHDAAVVTDHFLWSLGSPGAPRRRARPTRGFASSA